MKNLLLLALLVLFACKTPGPALPNDYSERPVYDIQKRSIGKEAMVVSAHPLATKAGLQILKQGGNAIDAAVAVQFALAVVYPRAGNIGGGGFMIYFDSEEMHSLDFREKAPAKAHKDMYLDENGEPIKDLSQRGHLAVGVPGVVDGMFEAHQKFGQLKWEEVLSPALGYAKEGILITEGEAASYNTYQDDFVDLNTMPSVFVNPKKWQAGDRLVQDELARTFSYIAEKGRDGFYDGAVAAMIVKEMNRGNGIISLEDLKNYKSVWREPLAINYKDQYMVYSMPPPSSGGIALAQLLNAVEESDLASGGFHSTESVHRMIEAARRAYADRAFYLGDHDYHDVPIKELCKKSYSQKRMEDFNPNKASYSSAIEAGSENMLYESEETTHFSIVDSRGRAVSLTTTLNSNYGSKVVVGEGGFFLNNEMDDFSAKPGVPNQFGLVGAEANSIRANKRMLSSMTPTIVLKDKKLFLVVGTPGGATIITSVYQVFLNIVEHNMSLEEAVKAKRFHHQWLPNKVFIEESTFSLQQIKALEKLGHTVEVRSPIGRVDAILVQPDGSLEGVGDIRGEDSAAGY